MWCRYSEGGLSKIRNNKQRFVLKIGTKRLRENNWNLNISIDEAKGHDELIALAESSTIRFIDELCGRSSSRIGSTVHQMRCEIRALKREPSTVAGDEKIRELYDEIDKLQFLPEYLCIVVDRPSDYRKACGGFIVNGLKFKRLLGTPGGIKNSTIVFVAEQNYHGTAIYDVIVKRLDNGRNMSMPLVPAKFEAYKALSCSASIPVPAPKGVIVVQDCVTKFKSDYILIDDEDEGEPAMSVVKDGEIELDASDGYGLISPRLAERWSKHLGEPSMVSGFCIRNAFCKGMVFPFDFVGFANCTVGDYIITDAWGFKRDVRDADLILTTSMLKLWDSYHSIEAYLSNCYKNHYSFSVTKTCELERTNCRELNYQFIQSYDLSDEDIEELIRPTLDDICGVLGGDVNKSILFLKGDRQNEEALGGYDDDFSKALMINPEVVNDPYVRERICQMIQRRIDNAKLGRVRVRGDYSVISGDPYSLCQSMFGLPVTGLLNAGEVYSGYWNKRGVDEVVCFRAPMSCHNNIRKAKVARNAKMDYWYQYMPDVLILNDWDMMTQALNGADSMKESRPSAMAECEFGELVNARCEAA